MSQQANIPAQNQASKQQKSKKHNAHVTMHNIHASCILYSIFPPLQIIVRRSDSNLTLLFTQTFHISYFTFKYNDTKFPLCGSASLKIKKSLQEVLQQPELLLLVLAELFGQDNLLHLGHCQEHLLGMLQVLF